MLIYVLFTFAYFRYLVGIVANNGALTSEASLKVSYNVCNIVAWDNGIASPAMLL